MVLKISAMVIWGLPLFMDRAKLSNSIAGHFSEHDQACGSKLQILIMNYFGYLHVRCLLHLLGELAKKLH